MNIPFLFSYHYIKASSGLGLLVQKLLEYRACDILIDSGAFSAHRLGKPIELEDYSTYCRSLEHFPRLWGCVQLDVVGNKEKTRENLARMLELGAKPMPVLTTDDGPESCEALYKVNPRFCVAGALGQWSGHMDWVCTRYLNCVAKVPADAAIHGLGFVRWPQMFQVGLKTVDSSSWTAGTRYGCLWAFDPAKGLVSKIPYRDAKHTKPEDITPEYKRFLTDSGVTLADFSDKKIMSSGATSFTSLMTAYGSVQQSSYARTRGLALYLAAASTVNMEMAYLVMKHGRKDSRGIDFHAARLEGLSMRAMPMAERLEYLARGIAKVNS